MPFVKKQWADRIPAAGKAGRRKLRNVDTLTEILYDVSMADDATTAGDEWNAENMNNLENRIAAVLTTDYKIQTGTFTPSVNISNVPTRTGTYYRIGNLCFVTIHIHSSNSPSSSSQIRISGLPFVPYSGDEQMLTVGYYQGVSPSGAKIAIIPGGSSNMNMWVNTGNSMSSMTHSQAGVFELRICGVYRIL